MRNERNMARVTQGFKRKACHLQLGIQINKAHAVGTAQLHIGFLRNRSQRLREFTPRTVHTIRAPEQHGAARIGARRGFKRGRQGRIGNGHGHTVWGGGQVVQTGVGRATVDFAVLGVDQKHLAFITQRGNGALNHVAKTALARARAHNRYRAGLEQPV